MGRLAGFRYRDIVKRLKRCGFEFCRQSVNTRYYVKCCPAKKEIYLYRVTAGTPTLVYTKDMSAEPYADDVWYGYRITVLNAPPNGGRFITLHIDGWQAFSVYDGDALGYGTVSVWHDSGETVECDEVEVITLPAENDYVDINS